jgi:hypothetical protein
MMKLMMFGTLCYPMGMGKLVVVVEERREDKDRMSEFEVLLKDGHANDPRLEYCHCQLVLL